MLRTKKAPILPKPTDTSAEHRLATQDLILDYCKRFADHDRKIDVDMLRGQSAIHVVASAIAAGTLDRYEVETQLLDWQLDFLKSAYKRIQQ